MGYKPEDTDLEKWPLAAELIEGHSEKHLRRKLAAVGVELVDNAEAGPWCDCRVLLAHLKARNALPSGWTWQMLRKRLRDDFGLPAGVRRRKSVVRGVRIAPRISEA